MTLLLQIQLSRAGIGRTVRRGSHIAASRKNSLQHLHIVDAAASVGRCLVGQTVTAASGVAPFALLSLTSALNTGRTLFHRYTGLMAAGHRIQS